MGSQPTWMIRRAADGGMRTRTAVQDARTAVRRAQVMVQDRRMALRTAVRRLVRGPGRTLAARTASQAAWR